MARFNKEKERTTFIVECFEEFYKAVLKHDQSVSTKPWGKEKGEAASSPNATA